MDTNHIVGIDIGGSGLKAALVDPLTGTLQGERVETRTPRPASPEAVGGCLRTLLEELGPGPEVLAGAGFPAVIKRGVALTASHIDDSWRDINVADALTDALGRKVAVLNDADAAALAEMHFGAGRGHEGTVVVVTLGTGIGTSLFFGGRLIPNMELANLDIRGKHVSRRASMAARRRNRQRWEDWAEDVEEYLRLLEGMTWPDLIIVGGGASEFAPEFFPHLDLRARVAPARMGNDAGIIGAALFAVAAQAKGEEARGKSRQPGGSRTARPARRSDG